MTREEIMAFSGRELDNAVECNFFHERYMKNGGHDSPFYSVCRTTLSKLEAVIQSSEIDNLQDYYLLNLLELFYTDYPDGYCRDTSHYFTLDCFAAIRFAAPADCCRAALLALRETLEKSK